jgi:alcohol dehydrogenase class IV
MLEMLPRLFQPKELVCKRGSLIRLQFLKGQRAALIIGKESLAQSGNLKKIETFLSRAKLETRLIDGISGDPTGTIIEDTVAKLTDFQPDWIIAAGGGAVMDCAKLARSLYENPHLSIKDISKPFATPAAGTKAGLVLIPTTSGSGSECSHVAVVKDDDSGQKIPIVSDAFIPDLAILDATLTIHLSPEVTAYTAMDALTHAIESYCSKSNNSMTDAYALMAGRMIKAHLSVAIKEPRNIVARENLQYAARLTGVAQNLTSVGAIHAIAHAIGSKTGLPHGYANAIFLPPVLSFNAQSSPRPLEFAKHAGFRDLEELLAWVKEIMISANLSQNWLAPATKTGSQDVSNEEIAELAMKDVCMRTNPAKIEMQDMINIIAETR